MRPFLLVLLLCPLLLGAQSFVTRDGTGFRSGGRPYFYMGTNYWYGSLLALGPRKEEGLRRMRRELDFLKARGVTNLRILGGAEGSGPINGVPRVGPALQPEKGRFDTSVLVGLDQLLVEMDRRGMKAVIFFSNNWEWSGGFLQYLNWNGMIPDSVLRRRLEWDEMRDLIAQFYGCAPCVEDYHRQVRLLLGRVNSVSGRAYADDPTIMAWEVANEPRPMRPAQDSAYARFIRQTAALIKARAPRQLVTLGHEGSIGTESLPLFEAVHADPNVDYATIHIWPRNWGWVRRDSLAPDMAQALQKTGDYIDTHVAAARRLGKPLVIEEFGFPRDETRFAPGTPTVLRDRYYDFVYGYWSRSARTGGPVAGINFWAFNGAARPLPGQVFWKPGDDYMGDPPMEEQSLYGVYDADGTTWKVIAEHLKKSRKNR